MFSPASRPVGDVIPFPRPPERPTPENATPDERDYYLSLRGQGMTDEMALEVLVQARRIRDGMMGVCHGD